MTDNSEEKPPSKVLPFVSREDFERRSIGEAIQKFYIDGKGCLEDLKTLHRTMIELEEKPGVMTSLIEDVTQAKDSVAPRPTYPPDVLWFSGNKKPAPSIERDSKVLSRSLLSWRKHIETLKNSLSVLRHRLEDFDNTYDELFASLKILDGFLLSARREDVLKNLKQFLEK